MSNTEPIELWYKQFWPWFIISLPASVVVASIITVVIAVTHEDSLVVKNYYRDGLAINRELRLEKNASLLGVKASVYFEKKTGEILADITGNFQQNSEFVSLLLSHPTEQRRDLLLQLKHTGKNTYIAHVDTPLEGRWYLRLSDTHRELWRLNTHIDFSKASNVDFSETEVF